MERRGRLTAPINPSDADDPEAWGISCFVVRTGSRRRGHAGHRLDAAITWAIENGARTLDACPVETDGKRPATQLYHGVAAALRARVFVECARRRPDRPLMQRTLNAAG